MVMVILMAMVTILLMLTLPDTITIRVMNPMILMATVRVTRGHNSSSNRINTSSNSRSNTNNSRNNTSSSRSNISSSLVNTGTTAILITITGITRIQILCRTGRVPTATLRPLTILLPRLPPIIAIEAMATKYG